MATTNAPQPAAPLGTQPDFVNLRNQFQNVTTGLQDVSTELGNFANIPAIAQGNTILTMLGQIRQDIQTFQNQTNQNFTNVRNDIGQLRNEMQTSSRASQYNSIARIENSAIRRNNIRLVKFRAYATNAAIPGFPATPAAISGMTGLELDPILQALDEDTTGTDAAKRRRLRLHIGLVDMPTS